MSTVQVIVVLKAQVHRLVEQNDTLRRLIQASEDPNQAAGTAGKHDFSSLYDAPNAVPYMQEMKRVGYVIADHTARVARRAIQSVFPNDTDADSEPPILLELCAGYGLTMSTIRTTHSCADVIEHFAARCATSPTSPQAAETDLQSDREFFARAARPLPRLAVCGQDVAANALACGKASGLFDETVCANLEAAGELPPAQAVLCRRARLVLATGAFSYITHATLARLFECWGPGEGAGAGDGGGGGSGGQAGPAPCPVFLFFPLVATKVSECFCAVSLHAARPSRCSPFPAARARFLLSAFTRQCPPLPAEHGH
jgi:hypothetical protein